MDDELLQNLAALERHLLDTAEMLRNRKFYFRHFGTAQQALYACNNTAKTMADLRRELKT